MAFVNKLVNPTPWKVRIPYARSTYITIEPDGEFELPNADMQRDFEPGQPGAEEVRHLLESYGVFLLNPDLSYDLQALRALEASYRSKKQVFDDFVQNVRQKAVASGQSINEETLEEAIEQSGYGNRVNARTGLPGLRGQLEAIQKRIKFLRKAVESDPTRGYTRENFDPEKTCFVTDPPRQFASKTALQMFLEENPAIRTKHEEFVKAQNG